MTLNDLTDKQVERLIHKRFAALAKTLARRRCHIRQARAAWDDIRSAARYKPGV